MVDDQSHPDAVMEGVRRLPAQPLRPYVAWYSGYRQAGLAPGRHRGLPSPLLTWIITIDEPITVAAHPDPRQAPGQYDGLIGGLHTVPALITHQGRQSGIQLGLTPLGARALLGLPAAELASLDVRAADILGGFESQIRERIRLAPTWPERFSILDDLLPDRIDGARAMPREIAGAWWLLTRSDRIAIPALAQAAGWSGRHLGERFRAEIGFGPKEVARIVRFDRARRLLQRRVLAAEPPALADLAAACGYYDQAHLAREFRAFAGSSPRHWLAAELRNIQSTPDPLMPESGHDR